MPSFKRALTLLGRVLLDPRQENKKHRDGARKGVVEVVRQEIVPSSKYKPHIGAKQAAKAKKRRLLEWEREIDAAISDAPCSD